MRSQPVCQINNIQPSVAKLPHPIRNPNACNKTVPQICDIPQQTGALSVIYGVDIGGVD